MLCFSFCFFADGGNSFSSSCCVIDSQQARQDLDKRRGGDRAENLGGVRVVLRAGSRPRPPLVELDEEERVLEGPPVDDGLHQVDQSDDHDADEEEGQEGPQVVPGHAEPVAQAAEAALVAGVGRVAGGIGGRSAV